MLTSYMVKCPHAGSDWFGSLLPCHDRHAWLGPCPSADEVEFRCPRCQIEWRALVVGDDVVPLVVEEVTAS
jgi:hypothetical protein